MRNVTPIEFQDHFKRVVRENATRVEELWTAPATQYTSFFRETILPQIATGLALNHYCEYWSLDAVFYEEKDTVHFRENETWAKYLAVAVEHENIGATSVREIYKLQVFNARLKVLITYAQDAAQADKLLAQYEKIIKAADCFEDVATRGRQLVIFGDNPSKGRAWAFHVYEASGFVRLE